MIDTTIETNTKILPAKYPRIKENFYAFGYGSDEEPKTSMWMSSILLGMGSHFKEGMIVYDYGCGAGRLCNFIASQLKDFEYYGTEPHGSNEQHGEKSIQLAQDNFGQDPRIHLGFIGEDIEQLAISKASVAVLGSIYTHLSIEAFNAINDKLLPIIERGGVIIFSAIIKEKYELLRNFAHGFDGCYGEAHYTVQQLLDYVSSRKLNIKHVGKFDVGVSFRTHYIFRMDHI